jgi:hypothetical protein
VDVSEARFQVQFYFNPFNSEVPDRSFTYALATNDILPEFHIIVQQPVAAEDFQHSLMDPEEIQGDFGLTFFREHIVGLQPEEVHTVNVAYKNPKNTLTLRTLQTRMEQAQSQSEAEQPVSTTKTSNLTIVVLIVGLLGVALFVVLKVWGGSGSSPAPVASQEEQSKAPGEKRGGESSSGGKFCPTCGTPRRPDARFCSSCGKEY